MHYLKRNRHNKLQINSWISLSYIHNVIIIGREGKVKGRRKQGGSIMTATNRDDQLGEIYSTKLNEFNCTFGFSFSHFHCSAVMVCGRHGIGPDQG